SSSGIPPGRGALPRVLVLAEPKGCFRAGARRPRPRGHFRVGQFRVREMFVFRTLARPFARESASNEESGPRRDTPAVISRYAPPNPWGLHSNGGICPWIPDNDPAICSSPCWFLPWHWSAPPPPWARRSSPLPPRPCAG